MNNTENLIFIQVEDYKFIEREKYNYIPNSKYLVKDFINDLNKNKISFFLRHGRISSTFLIKISILFCIITFIGKFSLYLILPIGVILTGIFLFISWIKKVVDWQEICNEVKNKHTEKLKEFYILTDETNLITPFSNILNSITYKLTPKIYKKILLKKDIPIIKELSVQKQKAFFLNDFNTQDDLKINMNHNFSINEKNKKMDFIFNNEYIKKQSLESQSRIDFIVNDDLDGRKDFINNDIIPISTFIIKSDSTEKK